MTGASRPALEADGEKMADTPRPLVVNAMTVDVEDYFQVSAFDSVVPLDSWDRFERRVAANTDRLLRIFAEFDVRATFFVLGWVAEREPGLVRRIAAAGHEIASHGYGHRLVYGQTTSAFREDVRRSRGLLQSLTGQQVLGYRAPSFSITNRSLWALDILIEEGFAYDASIFPILHDRYGIPSAPRHPFWVMAGAATNGLDAAVRRFGGSPVAGACLLELPGSTVRLAGANLPIGGGGYFRLLPYGWTRWGTARVNRVEGRPVMFYLHPWEVDPGQPRLPASVLGRLRHYRNLAQTEPRLRRLLGEFRFGPIETLFRPGDARSADDRLRTGPLSPAERPAAGRAARIA
jgi:polysaccharide deacetylase family protein (PEP-CTERM system associated)